VKLREVATRFDETDQPEDAVRAYETAIATGREPLETYLDAAVLCWICTDGGYAAHHHISREFINHAEQRARELLGEAAARFGPFNEIEFWRYYFDHISYGQPARLDYCETLAKQGPSLVPYFHLYAITGDERYSPQAEALWHDLEPPNTQRVRYVRSVLGGALGREHGSTTR